MLRALHLGVLAAVAVLVTAAAPPQAQWRRLDSPNFIVIGEVSAGELRDIAVQFEGFRDTLGMVLNERVISTAVPTVVIVFRSDASFTPFKPMFQGKRVNLGGLFVARRDANHIAMVSDGSPGRLRIIFHEYAHLLINNTGQRIPTWLNEGLAEYYSTFELYRGGREAVIGRFVEGHIQRLNDTPLLPLQDLLNVDRDSPLYNESSRRSVFYAQAWALTHLILRGEPSRVPQLSVYVQQLSDGVAPMDAWTKAFGSQDMARELERYIRRQSYNAMQYKFADKLATFQAEAVPIPPADVQAYLADFQAQRGELDDAGARLASALKLDPASARATLVMAALDLAKRDFAAAETRTRAAGDLKDWFWSYFTGVVFVGALEGRRAQATADDLDTARQWFARARADRPEFANALARMAALELRSAAGPTPETRASVERARSIAPGRHEYTMLLAQVLARQSEFAAARAVLGPLLTPTYPVQVRENAKSLMSSIVNMEAARASRASSVPSGSSILPAPPAGRPDVSPPEPTGVERPAFRALAPGEQRLDGTLESIDCVVGKGVTFQIRSGAGLVPVMSPDLTSVQFISYRTDLKGSIRCGPVKPALPVYVTWRAGADGKSKVVVAIEYPPK